jgi:hypothetical protein
MILQVLNSVCDFKGLFLKLKEKKEILVSLINIQFQEIKTPAAE